MIVSFQILLLYVVSNGTQLSPYYINNSNLHITIRSQDNSLTLNYNYCLDADSAWTDSTNTWLWDDRWEYYNCYAFAIQRFDPLPWYYDCLASSNAVETYHPGQFQGYQYGFRVETEMPIQQCAELVKNDLIAFGCTNVSTHRLGPFGFLPTLGANEQLIALRYGYQTDGDDILDYDYHFMRYDAESNAWYHKPGKTAPLRYKYGLSESVNWYSEGITYEQLFQSDYVYSGEIWLVKYTHPIISISPGAVSSETQIFVSNQNDVVAFFDIEEAGTFSLDF